MDLTVLDRKEATKYGMQHFVVTGDKPNGTGWRHMRVGIVAPDIDKAIAKVRELHYGCRIFSVAHHGPIEVMVKE